MVSLDIQPFYNGPNLDVLAKLYDSTGTLIATSDSINDLDATFTDQPLLPGTYYVSIQGASRPITFIDPAFHPGPFEADGQSARPALPPDTSDWGYTNYGSLGYYSITRRAKEGLGRRRRLRRGERDQPEQLESLLRRQFADRVDESDQRGGANSSRTS